MSYWLGVIGVWLFSDGLYSLLLYWGKPSHRGTPQDWVHDHWLRVVRMGLGLAVIALGWYFG